MHNINTNTDCIEFRFLREKKKTTTRDICRKLSSGACNNLTQFMHEYRNWFEDAHYSLIQIIVLLDFFDGASERQKKQHLHVSKKLTKNDLMIYCERERKKAKLWCEQKILMKIHPQRTSSMDIPLKVIVKTSKTFFTL